MVGLGQLEKNAWSFAFSLIWVFQRRASGAVRSPPKITGNVPSRRPAISAARDSRSFVERLEGAAAASTSDSIRGADAGQRGGLDRGDGHVGDRRARLQDARQADDRDAVLAGPVDERAAGADDDPPRADRGRGHRSRPASPRFRPSSWSRARSSPRRPSSAGRSRGP